MSFDLSSWLWWRLVSLVVVVLMWLLLAFGVRATPVAAHATPAARIEFGAARQPFAIGPCEGRLETTARRFESQSAPQSALANAEPRSQGRL
jgi:hypothetical protein